MRCSEKFNSLFARGVGIVDFGALRLQSCECYDTVVAYRTVLELD
jgi:hypothetical protein